MDRTITVTGSAKVRVRPDTIRIEANLTGTCRDYDDAVALSADSIASLKASISDAGFDPESLRTRGLSVSMTYDRSENGGRVFAGYAYNHSLRMTIGAEEGIGRLLGALTSASGAPEFHVSYAVRDPSIPLAEARDAAVKDAALKAQALAQSAGVILGPIVSINYVSNECHFTAGNRMLMSSAGSDITPDDVEFSDSVAVQWEIS